MNYLLHRQKFPDNVVSIPEGLSDLIGDITREVLRCQPDVKEIYGFIANYLDALLKSREKLQVADQSINDILNNVLENVLTNSGLLKEKADEACHVIKKYFQEFMDEKREEKIEEGKLPKEFREAALISDLISKCKFTELEIMKSRPNIQIAFKNFIEKYIEALKGLSFPIQTFESLAKYTFIQYMNDAPTRNQFNNAAIKIQAGIRGFLARKNFDCKRKNCVSGSRGLNISASSEISVLEQIKNTIVYDNEGKKTKISFGTPRVETTTTHETDTTTHAASTRNESAQISEEGEICLGTLKYSDTDVDKLENSARIIQSFYRGYKVRKDIKDAETSTSLIYK